MSAILAEGALAAAADEAAVEASDTEDRDAAEGMSDMEDMAVVACRVGEVEIPEQRLA